MPSDRPRREQITIRAPIGTSWTTYGRALNVAHSFAVSYGDRRAGKRHGVVYDHGYLAYWTPTRSVVVEVML